MRIRVDSNVGEEWFISDGLAGGADLRRLGRIVVYISPPGVSHP